MTPPVTHATSTTTSTTATEAAESAAEPQLVAEDLIEEVSIDGMCGVY
jgi:mycofactocin precursor